MDTTPYGLIANQFPYGLCVVDGEGKILSMNPALEQFLGWRAMRWCGQSFASCLEQAIPDPDQAQGWTGALKKALTLGETTHLNLLTDFRILPGDAAPGTGGPGAGELVSATGVVAPWQDGEGASGAFAIFQDGSFQKDLHGAQARFLAVLSHELGAPVVNLGAAADLLAHRLEGDDEKLRRLVQIVRSEASHLRRILAQLPTALPARIDVPQLRRDVVTLRPILRQVAQTFDVRDLDCRIVVEVPTDLAFAWCDAERIRELVGKLVENVIGYTLPGGQIVLAAQEGDDGIMVSISGRSPDDLPDGEEGISASFSFSLPFAQGLSEWEEERE